MDKPSQCAMPSDVADVADDAQCPVREMKGVSTHSLSALVLVSPHDTVNDSIVVRARVLRGGGAYSIAQTVCTVEWSWNIELDVACVRLMHAGPVSSAIVVSPS